MSYTPRNIYGKTNNYGSAVGTSERFLLIDTDSFLLIGDGKKLLIQAEVKGDYNKQENAYSPRPSIYGVQ